MYSSLWDTADCGPRHVISSVFLCFFLGQELPDIMKEFNLFLEFALHRFGFGLDGFGFLIRF